MVAACVAYQYLYVLSATYIAGDDSSQGVEIGVLVAVCLIALAASIGIMVVIIWSVNSRRYMFISIYVHCMYTLYPTRQQTHV